jgi:hypothetical protein
VDSNGEIKREAARTRKLVQDTEEPEDKAVILLHLAKRLQRDGVTTLATEVAAEGLNLLSSKSKKMQSDFLTLLGDLHRTLGNGLEARQLFENALNIDQQLAD